MMMVSLMMAAVALQLPPLEWKCGANTSISNDVVYIDASADHPGGGVTAAFDLRPFRTQSFRLCVAAEMKGVAKGKYHWEGLKFCLAIKDRRTGETLHPEGAFPRSGDMALREIDLSVDFATYEADKGELWMGLQGVAGCAMFDLSTLRIEPMPAAYPITNENYRVRYPDSVMKEGRRRGVMLPGCDPTEEDFATLGEWGATLARYQMTNCPQGGVTNLPIYRAWMAHKLDHLEQVVIPCARRYGMKVVVDVHGPPGGRHPDMNFRLFDDESYLNEFLDLWRGIARRFKGVSEIYGYDFANEPFQKGAHRFNYWEVQRLAAEAVREIDPDATLIVEANHMDLPRAFSYLSPLAMDNVIYQVHMYEPGIYTHQGVTPKDPRGLAYGGVMPDGSRLNRDYLKRQLAPVLEFQRRHTAKIYVGEFSAICWAEGAGDYLTDCISIFEEYGWDWTYHAFREWACWSVEHEGLSRETMSSSQDNPRRRALLNGLKGRIR